MSNSTSSPAKRAQKRKLTLRAVHEELARLRARVEDLEDLRELNEAIERNAGKKLIPWIQAKKELGIDN